MITLADQINDQVFESYDDIRKSADYLFKQKQYYLANQSYKRIFRQWPKQVPSILLQYEMVLKDDVCNIELKSLLAELYLCESNEDEAIYEYEDILEEDPFNLDIYLKLAQLYFKAKDYHQVIKLLQKPYSYNICDERMINILAASYIETKDILKAIEIYESLISLNGEKENYLRTLSDLYFRDNRYVKATESAITRLDLNKNSSGDVIVFIEKCCNASENNWIIYKTLIDLYVDYNLPDSAVEMLRSFLTSKYDDEQKSFIEDRIHRLLKGAPDYPEGLLLQGNFYKDNGLYSESAESYWALAKNEFYAIKAVEGLKSVLELYPTQLSALQYLGEYYKQTGDTSLALKYMRSMLQVDFSKSIAVISQCKDLIESNPQNYYAKLTMAEAYYNRENYHQSIELAQELIKQGENTIEATKVLIRSLIAMKDYISAREVFERESIHNKDNMELFNFYENIYKLELNIKKEMLRIKAENSEELDPKLEYVNALIESSSFEHAIIQLQQIQKIFNNYKIDYYQALCYIGMCNYYSAIVSLKKAHEKIFVDAAPEKLEILHKLAKVNEIIGEIDDSLKYYRKILEIDYQREDVKEKEYLLKNCPYLDVAGKSLIAIAKNIDGKDLTAVFNRNMLKKKRKDSVDSSMGVLKNNEAVNDIFLSKLNSANDLLEIAIKMDPAHTNILNNKGVLYILRNDWGAASKIYDKILKNKNTVSAAALYNLAYVNLYGWHKDKQALDFIKQLLSFEDQFYEAYLLLGDIYFYQGNLKLAKENWKIYQESGLLSFIANRRMLEVNFVPSF
ncbi:MAG: hypothetical protein A2Y40_00430 [Candidatus Margulisbacteria bacterium GWF2_35_9]|nr:MAG: hypothetical protein A2Y40_00430 [Candidatus Margulisbacteria bacterium GWF2_35_9]